MTSDLYTLFKNDTETQAPKAELLNRVFVQIEKAQAKKIRQQKTIWSIVSSVFFVTVILTGWHAVSSIASSNLSDYLSLIFSDTSSAFLIWKELGISIIDSLPIIGIGLFLASIYLLFWSARKYTVSSKTLAY